LPDSSDVLVNAKENWAIEPGRAEYTVIDIDPKNGGDETWAELEARYGRVSTREVRTPSGGRHLWFRGTVPAVNRRLGRGIDTRCFGGYVLLPPSRVKGRTYTWINPEVPIAPLPAWIVEEIEAAAAREHEIRDELREQIHNGEGSDAFECRLALIGDHEGGLGFYDPMVRAAGAGVALGMDANEIFDRIQEAAEAADRHNHSLTEINDRLSKMMGAIRAFQVKDVQRRREAGETDEKVEPDGDLGNDDDLDQEFAEAMAAQEAGEFSEPEWDKEEEVANKQGPFTEAAGVDDTSEPIGDAFAAEEPEEPIEPAAEQVHEPEPEPGPPPPPEPEPESEAPQDPRDAAVENVQQIVKEWVRRGKKHARNLVALQLPAGFGKTRIVLTAQQQAEPTPMEDMERFLDEDSRDLPEHEIGKLACAVGRHNLAAEIQETDASMRPARYITRSIPILAGRGPDNCGRWPVVEAGFRKGFSQASFCSDAAGNLCPLFETCHDTLGQYQHTQEAVQQASNAIVMHSHLGVPWLRALALKTRTRMWMDENPTGVFRDSHEIDAAKLELVSEQDLAALDRWVIEEPKLKALQQRTRTALQNLGKLSAVLLTALASPAHSLKLEDLAAWSPGQIREMADARETIETWRRGKLDPSLDDAALKEQLAKHKPVPRRTGLIHRLADELEARKTGPIYSLEWDRQNGKIISRGRIPTDKLPPNLLITDATVSPEILKAVFPGHALEHVKIEVPRRAHITQVKDLTFSRNWLVNKKHLPEVTAWLGHLAQYYKDLVVITTKRLRCAITGEDPKGKLSVYCEEYHATHGIKIAHYGNIRGTNAFKDCDALVVLGRAQPNPEEIEEIAKAFWYDTDKPLRLAKKGAAGGKVYDPGKRFHEMSDGTKVKGNVEVHPDPRCQAVLADARENEQIQSIDRARLIWNTDLKHIYILCNIPLPGVKIDQLLPWDNLRGVGRLNKAIAAQVARGKSCLPLAAEWLAVNYSNLWKNENEARKMAVRDPQVLEIMRRAHSSYKTGLLEGGAFLEITIIEYLPDQRKPGHNQWSHALVWGDIAPEASLARALGLKETEFRWRPAPECEPRS
jgi:hypothetical protein